MACRLSVIQDGRICHLLGLSIFLSQSIKMAAKAGDVPQEITIVRAQIRLSTDIN